ncbi:MAG: ABC transporter ATP-binding protein [Anaerolineae bacterium]|nr:ABC transporter ATP-binding protein [Anaerolineae bacterium]
MASGLPIIEINDLTKVYAGKKGGLKALDSLTLSAYEGEILGYLGPNGAGKTTTIRLLLDLIRPTSGSARIFGLDVNRDSLAIRQRISYLPAELVLWDNQTALEIVNYFGRAHGGVDMRYVNELAERLEFDLGKKIRQYSTGNKRKIGLILALMHKPDLLILDEPSSGLDPLMQQIFIQLLREARDAGQTIFLSSHVLSEVQAVCDRVAILRDGRLRMVDRVDVLTQVDFYWVNLRLREKIDADVFRQVQGVNDISVNGDQIRLRLNGDFDPLMQALNGHYVLDVRTEDPTLEEIFLNLYGDLPSLNGRNRKPQVNEKESVK